MRQALVFALLMGVLVWMFHLTSTSLRARGVHTGFAFLAQPAITPVYNAPLEFVLGVDSITWAFAAGALNTLKVTLGCILLSTVIGVSVGLAGISSNPLVRCLSSAYVEIMRNVPVLLHIVFWYGLMLELPPASDTQVNAWWLASNRGLFLMPEVDGLAVSGWLSVSPEFAALLLGISLYTAAFISEIVRASIGSVSRGQWEASAALGLSPSVVLRRVIMPQALKVALPAQAGEYIGIFKNSTLAIAIGFQDFMSIGETTLADTGQSVEVMAVVMVFYALVSLLVSAAMHLVEKHSRHQEAA